MAAGNQRTMPELTGVVTHILADLTREPSTPLAPAYYVVHTSLPKPEIERLGVFRLVPGMPAETFIRTYALTPMQYLLKSLQVQMSRTFRER